MKPTTWLFTISLVLLVSSLVLFLFALFEYNEEEFIGAAAHFAYAAVAAGGLYAYFHK